MTKVDRVYKVKLVVLVIFLALSKMVISYVFVRNPEQVTPDIHPFGSGRVVPSHEQRSHSSSY